MTIALDRSEKERIALLLQEKQRRLTLRAETPWLKYRTNPVGFFTEVLKYFIWSKQREICEALVKYDRVAVQSCHESGKSFVCGGIIPWWIAVHPPKEAMVVTTAPTFPQVRAILWKEVNRNHALGNLPGYTNQTEWLIDKELVAFGRKPEDSSPAAFQGIHARFLLLVVDEACGVKGPLWEAAESLVANEDSKILAIGNPDDPNTEFGKICKPGSGWHVIKISAFDTPNLTEEQVPDDLKRRLISSTWVERQKRRLGETNPIYISKVLGEFPETSEDSLVHPVWVADAVRREIEPLSDELNELGVDVARSEHGNETVIYHRHDCRARLWKALRTRDTMHIVGLVIQAIRETGATTVKIDDVGVGGGVTDRLKELTRDRSMDFLRQVKIIGVNVGAAPIDRPKDRRERINVKQRYSKLKAQISWELRERFREGFIDLDDDLDTQAQICNMRYEIDSRGRLHIESKEDYQERLHKLGGITVESESPDRWDALVLAFAEIEGGGFQISDALLHRSRLPALARRY